MESIDFGIGSAIIIYSNNNGTLTRCHGFGYAIYTVT